MKEKIAACAIRKITAGEFPGIIFVRTKKYGRRLCEVISSLSNGQLNVPFISSEMSKAERKEIANKLARCDSGVPFVVSTRVWSTGINIPSLRWVLLGGGGKAPIGILQEGARGSRLSEGKEACEVIDIEDKDTLARAERFQQEGYECELSDEDFLESLFNNDEIEGKCKHRRGGRDQSIDTCNNQPYTISSVLGSILGPIEGYAIIAVLCLLYSLFFGD